MPSIQVTAVSTGSDTLTAVAHGLLTGDRFVLRNTGGALPAATPALAGATTYFAVRVDADTIKVAETSGAALAGTPVVNITGAGSGTTFVEHSLPYCENRVAAPLTQVFSEDDNEAWASLVALHRMLTGQPQSIWTDGHPVRPEIYPGIAAIQQGGTAISRDITTGAVTSNGPAALMYAFPVRPGDHLLSVVIAAFGDGAADAAVSLVKVTAGGATTTVASGSITNAPASWADYTFSGTATIGARDALFLAVSPNATGLMINNVQLSFDHPSS